MSDQNKTTGKVLTFDLNRPRARSEQAVNERSLMRVLRPQNAAAVLALMLKHRPLETMSEADVTSPPIGADDFSGFRRELQAIERAYREGCRAGRMAVIAARRAQYGAGYNVGLSDERASVEGVINKLIA
jgi:hypothetical protein